MKKALSVFMALVLALGLLSMPSAASAAMGESILLANEIGEGLYLNGFEFVGETLYAISAGNLLVLKEGDSASQVYPLTDIGAVATDQQVGWRLIRQGDALHALDLTTGHLYPLVFSGETPRAGKPLSLDWDSFERDAGNGLRYISPPQAFQLTEKSLYAIEGETGNRLITFSLETGEKTDYQSAGFEAMSAYRDESLLVFSRAEGDGWSIGRFDPARDKVSPVGAVSVASGEDGRLFGISYHAPNDTLYVGLDGQVLAYPALGEPLIATLLPPVMALPEGLRIGPDGLCAVLTIRGLILRSLDPLAMADKKSLTIWGYEDWPAMSQAALSLGDVIIKRPAPTDEDTIEKRLALRDSDIDIYRVSMPMSDFQAIMDKGFFEDLSQIPDILARHRALYPLVADALQKDGQIAAVPVNAQLWDLVMADTGFFADEKMTPPASFGELCDLIKSWPTTYAVKYPDMQPLPGFLGPRWSLTTLALGLYLADGELSGEAPRLDTDTFRQMLAKVDEALAAFSQEGTGMDDFAPPVLSLGEQGDIRLFHGDGRDGRLVKPLALAAQACRTPPLQLSLDVLIVNPLSRDKETAFRFMAAVTHAMPQSLVTMLSPGENTPLPNPSYAKTVANMEQRAQTLAEQIDKAQDAEKSELETQLETLKRRLDDYRATEQFALNEVDIKAYRQAMEGGVIHRGGPAWQLKQALRDTLMRYADGQIDSEHFIKEAQNKLDLMMKEAK